MTIPDRCGIAVVFLTVLAILPVHADSEVAGSAAAVAPAVPAPLQPWVDWVLHDRQQLRCPRLYSRPEQHRCAWPSVLSIDLSAAGASFAQRWTVDAPGWLTLPGDRQHWPQQVTLDNQPAVVLERDGRPALRADPGERLVSGRFSWQRLPDRLRVPEATALLSLSQAGASLASPGITADGYLWLREREPAVSDERDALSLEVFRLVRDDIPLLLTTRIELQVSGRVREQLLGPVLPAGFVPLAINGSLAARLENDGRLRVQLKPGNWQLELSARHLGVVDELSMPAADEWVAQEIWAFQAVNRLRVVTVSGAPGIDPNQTRLPPAWRQLPAYVMTPQQSLTLTTRQRGDPTPAANRLQLQRTLWLDFAGGGYSVQDRLSGTLTADTRLTAAPPLRLGRVAVNGEDQFITRLPNADPGVELRRQNLDLIADSRLQPAAIGELPAVGWNAATADNRTLLNLPPGWRLLATAGADSASNTWLMRWSLLDIFVVLIISLSFARLWAWWYGVLALLGLALFYHEPGAPRLIWLNVLAAVALVQLLPDGRARQLTRWYRDGSLLVLLVVGFLFVAQQVRYSLYPQLERGGYYPSPSASSRYTEASPPAAPPPAAETMLADRARPGAKPASPAGRYQSNRMQYSPDIQVQTGPGLPDWQWRQAVLSWSGPVAPEQRLRLYLLPPWATRVWLLAAVALLLLMFARLLRPPRWHPGLLTGLRSAEGGAGG